MISTGSLVVYKNQPARVASCADGKITIELESGETKKVREKDVSLLHPGHSLRMPSPRDGGDFDTAHAMLVAGLEGRKPVPTSWKELSELVFGDFSQESAMACVIFAAKGILFRIAEGEPFALSEEELDHISRKSEEKLFEAERKASFIAALRAALKQKESGNLRETREYTRYISDLESFALGVGERCPIAAEAGIAETREAVHQALLDSCLWDEAMNPWPSRAGCALSPVKLGFPSSELPPFAVGREDLTRIVAYAIDNAWSNDPDDAIAIDGDFLWVHVADPAAFVAPDSPVDAEALSRGATLYLPEKTIPMLPAEAVGRLGLGLSDTSPALSFGMRLSEDGSIAETRIVASRVRVSRLSYEAADEMLKNGHADLVRLEEFAELRHKRRLANEAVDIDFPEVSIKVDAALPHFDAVP
ncbi:MAG TPA: RNB domain-containing ribonuclease, partial [Rectinemataceae bacterium]|nr:RNB domain-containing ribonuclease [Rectinemataceae bacterium]